jgi:hypothetical protein
MSNIAKQAFLAGYMSKMAAVNKDPLEGKDAGYVGKKSGNGMDPASGKEVASGNPADKVTPKGTFKPVNLPSQFARKPGSAPQPAPKYINGERNVKPTTPKGSTAGDVGKVSGDGMDARTGKPVPAK